jgi:hypothetical protein
MKINVDNVIKVYGQEAIVLQIEKIINRTFAYLNHSIVVPDRTYSRDYVEISEITDVIDDSLILSWYHKGFSDELNGTSNTESDINILNKAYSFGALDAIVGDDVRNVDYKTNAEILKIIKNTCEY